MTRWSILALVAVILVSGGALYIRLRWHRAPQAHQAMIALAACYFVAGSIAGAWILHLSAPKPSVLTQVAAPSAVATSPSAVAPTNTFPIPIPPLHYDPVHAALPDPTLTPGDTWPG